MIVDFFSKKGTSLDKVSPSCFTDLEMNEVMERSKKMEAELVPEFFASSKGMVTMANELEERKSKHFCDANITAVIDQYQYVEELKALFA